MNHWKGEIVKRKSEMEKRRNRRRNAPKRKGRASTRATSPTTKREGRDIAIGFWQRAGLLASMLAGRGKGKR